MSNPTPVPIVAVVAAPAPEPTPTFSTVVDSKTTHALKEYVKDPDSLTSQQLLALATGNGVETLQLLVTQLTTIAAAFTPPPPPAPGITPFENFGHAIGQVMHAAYAPLLAMQGQIDDLKARVARLEKAQEESQSLVNEKMSQLGANIASLSREVIANRDGLKELRDARHGDEQKILHLEQRSKSAQQYMHGLHNELVSVLKHHEGWNEKVWLDLVVLIDDEGRGGHRRK